MRIKTALTVLAAVIVPMIGTAATYTWNGSAVDGNWSNASNWDSEGVPASLTAAGSAEDTIIFDGANMPSLNLATYATGYGNDSATLIFNSGGIFNLDMSTLPNGGMIMNGESRTIVTVGDGAGGGTDDVVVNISNVGSLLRHSSVTADYLVKSDGVLNFSGNLPLYGDNNKHATLTLDGGVIVATGNLDARFNTQADSYVEFISGDGSFTAAYGGDFANFAAVQANASGIFVDSAGGGLEFADLGSSYRVSAIPPPVIPQTSLILSTNLVSAPFNVQVNFSESVTGLELSDFVVSNCTATSLSGVGSAYIVEITPTATGYCSFSLPADAVIDGDANGNTPSEIITVLYVPAGSEQSVATLSTSAETVFGVFSVDVVFNEAVTGLELDDFIVENGWVTNLTGSGDTYAVELYPEVEGDVSLNLPKETVMDTDGDQLPNLGSNEMVVFYKEPLGVTIYGSGMTDEPIFNVYVTFSEPIAGTLLQTDIEVLNGTVLSLTEQSRRDFAKRFYIVELRADTPGDVTISIPVGTVTNQGPMVLENLASVPFTVHCTTDFNQQWVVDEEADWSAASLVNSNLTLSGGYADPGVDNAVFTSVMKSFPAKTQPTAITFQQSSAWANWTAAAGRLGGPGGNAPILVPIADNNYYFLAQQSSAYHAWHSTNMVDWVHRGPITQVGHNWVTTCEYKDGTFYIYVDIPNDHTPQLYTDDNLDDGIIGTWHGIAFNDPTSGSDSAIIRDNADGLFHIISEDYTPIYPNSHSFDSPLATHASSEDGFTGFVPAEHVPPIDFRTEPTGEIGYWNHPHIDGSHISNPIPYEIHEPDQPAYGDWTAIKIGERYYLFSDYHAVGEDIRTAWLCSDSLYEQFEQVGDIDSNGHPDPTVGFAEGQFYLITQYTDFTSPGPWVDGVEARAGVDVDGDNIVDQWTVWQTVSEQYDHTPNFVRVVTTTPAQLDLTGLPAGYGFQFEFRVDNTVVSGVSPIMDSVVMDFEPTNFQEWANTNGIPAEANADNNANGVPDVIEFSIGQTVVPERQADGTMSVTAVNDAVEDGLEVELWFTDSLLESWSVAEADTEGVKLLSDAADPEGNQELVFEIFDRNGTNIFWKLVVVSPE